MGSFFSSRFFFFPNLGCLPIPDKVFSGRSGRKRERERERERERKRERERESLPKICCCSTRSPFSQSSGKMSAEKIIASLCESSTPLYGSATWCSFIVCLEAYNMVLVRWISSAWRWFISDVVLAPGSKTMVDRARRNTVVVRCVTS